MHLRLMMSLMALQTKLSVVIHTFSAKLKRNSDEVLKKLGKYQTAGTLSKKNNFLFLDNVPIALPSLLRAAKLQSVVQSRF